MQAVQRGIVLHELLHEFEFLLDGFRRVCLARFPDLPDQCEDVARQLAYAHCAHRLGYTVDEIKARIAKGVPGA